MKVLVIGFGSMGRRHAANAHALGHGVIVHDIASMAVAGPAPYLFASRLEGALNEKPVAVVIAAPAHAHAELYWEAVTVGCHVFIEKPLFLTCAEFRDSMPSTFSVDTGVIASRIVQAGYNFRFHPGIESLRARLAEVGQPVTAARSAGVAPGWIVALQTLA